MKRLILALVALALASNFALAGGGGGGDAGGGADILKLDPFIVNLSGPNGHIAFTAQLKTDPKDLDVLKAFTPVIRFAFIKEMIGTASRKAETPAFMKEFAENAVEFINEAISRHLVTDVYFTDWIVQ